MNRNIVEKAIDAPAEMLQLGVEGGQKVAKTIPISGSESIKKAKDYWYMLGPGLTTGASDDDPSGIATYSQAGAQFGFGLIWMAIFTFPLMAVVQEMCARIGLATGRGLAGNIKIHFSRRVLYISTIFLFAANTFNIGADIGAMAKASQLLAPHASFTLLVVGFTFLILFLQIFTPYVEYARYLKWLALVLLAYIVSALLSHPAWPEVLRHSLVPHLTFSKEQLLLICAILGTTISPYLFFWQTSQEVEEQVAIGQTTIKQRKGSDPHAIKKMRIDVWSGMLLSNLVMFFIIAACGSVLFTHGVHNIDSAAQAAQALKPFAGEATYWLFTIGIVGMGLLAIPILAGSSSYAISESLGRRQGLNHKLKHASTFYGVIIISMLTGLAMNFIGLNPIKALIYAAVANGIVAPVVLVLILMIARNRKIMGDWTNSKLSSGFGWFATILMSVAGLAAIYSLFA
ncbi:MAG TPA: Nramp family divalent metal transporter [Candidatus Saccharimonadales bacterium]|nr:Nramp family divalent metal transporter [Candidatus Saccharimonadales bacterium]